MFASGSQLAQSRPSGTTAISVFTSTTGHEVSAIWVCNTTGSAAKYSIFHDDDGSTFDQTTALAYDVSLAANSYVFINFGAAGGGIHVAKSGQIGVKTDTASALTFTLYGISRPAR